MFEIIGMLVVGLVVIAIAVAVIVILIKTALVLVPIFLVIGAICLFGIFFCDGNKDSSDYNIREPLKIHSFPEDWFICRFQA